MITEHYTTEEIVKMCRSTELKILPIVTERKACALPSEYMLYGAPVDGYSEALTALRDVCDEISRRKRRGLVMPRVIVSVDNVDALLLRSPDGEIAGLLDIIDSRGRDCGVELVA